MSAAKFLPMTRLQYASLFQGVNATAAYLCCNAEEYRKRILREELGLASFKEVDRVHGFEKLMQRIFADRGDYARALDYVAGDEKRLRHLALDAAKHIVCQTGSGTPSEMDELAMRYVAGVIVQMKFSRQTVGSLAMKLQRNDGWDDFTTIQLKKVVSALQARIRRHR